MFGKDITNKKPKISGRKEKEIQVKKRLEELEKQRIQIQNARKLKMQEKASKSQRQISENKKKTSNRASVTLRKAKAAITPVVNPVTPVNHKPKSFSKARSLPPNENKIKDILKEQKNIDPDFVFKNRKSQTIDLHECYENYKFDNSGYLNKIDESNNWGNDSLNSSELIEYKKQQNSNK